MQPVLSAGPPPSAQENASFKTAPRGFPTAATKISNFRAAVPEYGFRRAELVAVLLRSGVKGKDAVTLARELLSAFGGQCRQLS